MKKLLLFLLLFGFKGTFALPLPVLYSPDKTLAVQIDLNGGLSYSVSLDHQTILSRGMIDLDLHADGKLSDDLEAASSSLSSVNEIITQPFSDNRKRIPNIYNQLTIHFPHHFVVIFRAYNDGVAYRIVTNFADSITVEKETATFQFPASSHVYAPLIQKRDSLDIFHTSFEEPYQYKDVDSLTATDVMFSPALISTPGGIKIGLTESDLDDYPGMFLQGTHGNALEGAFAPVPLKEKITGDQYPEMVVTRRAGYIARTQGSRNFPWRVLIIARKDKELPANDLVYRLAAPSRIKDLSWIHPGKGTDEWIIDVNLFNVPFKSGVNTASYKYYIDFARRFGFNRIMMDAGWSDPRDLFKINPDIDMDSIAAYAKLGGIHLSMWTLAMTLSRQLIPAIAQFKKWGVDFIMTDFIDRDDQPTVDFYKRVTAACAKAHLMIMFHGAFPPKGFNRTWPNNITREGVLGSEYNAWSDKATPEHNVTIPFTRMLAGPLDYEPGLLDNATRAQFRPIWGKVMSQGTRCQQMAMFIVYDDPMPIFSGNPSQGYREPQFMQLLGSLPTTWDTTRILEASVAQYIVTARKKGDDWYLGAMTNWQPRDVILPLNFLGSGQYDATICEDGVNADRYPSDYRILHQGMVAGDSLRIHMAPGGGFLVVLKPKKR